jgi:hypothetical protein
MSSVPGGIAAGKQDGFVFGFGFLKSFFTPTPRISIIQGCGVEEVGAGFVNQAVDNFGFSHLVSPILLPFISEVSVFFY